jgi:hypothetical protein
MRMQFFLLVTISLISLVNVFCSESIFADLGSGSVEITKIEILKGQYEATDDFIYLFEDESYLVRIEMTIPKECKEGIKLTSKLIGSIWIKEIDKRSRTSELEFDLPRLGNSLTVDLEGRAPKALIVREENPATTQDNRIIRGEKEFELLEIEVSEKLLDIRVEQSKKFILSSHEIFNARKKISEAHTALEILKTSRNSDMKILKDITERIETLLVVAEECVEEGAPEQAFEIANECFLLARSNILEDQVRMFNSIMAETDTDFSESSKLTYESLDGIEQSKEEKEFSEFLARLEDARNNLETAKECYIETVNDKISQFELSVLEVALLVAAILGSLLLVVFYLVLQKTKSKVFKNGMDKGRREAAKEKFSPRDVILGKTEGGEE